MTDDQLRLRRRAAAVWRTAQALSEYRQAVLDDSPAIYWPMDEAGGTVITDISGNDRHGTVNGVPTFAQAGLLADDAGGSMLFDANTEFISRAYNATIMGQANFPITLELWIRLNTSTEIGVLQRSQTIQVIGRNDSARWVVAGGTSSYIGSFWATATIYHYVLILRPTQYVVYINNVLMKTSAVGSWGAFTAQLEIGRALNPHTSIINTLKGRAAHAALYTGELGVARIAAHYNIGIGA